MYASPYTFMLKLEISTIPEQTLAASRGNWMEIGLFLRATLHRINFREIFNFGFTVYGITSEGNLQQSRPHDFPDPPKWVKRLLGNSINFECGNNPTPNYTRIVRKGGGLLIRTTPGRIISYIANFDSNWRLRIGVEMYYSYGESHCQSDGGIYDIGAFPGRRETDSYRKRSSAHNV